MAVGTLCERAAQVLLDDIDMGLSTAPDFAALFAYSDVQAGIRAGESQYT